MELRRGGGGRPHPRGRRRAGGREIRGRGRHLAAALAAQGQRDRHRAARRQAHLIARLAPAERGRWRVEGEICPALDIVAAAIGEDEVGGAQLVRQQLRPRCARCWPRTSNMSAKSAAKAIAQGEGERVVGEALDVERFEAGAVIEHLAAQQMDLVARQHHAIAVADVRIGEVDREGRVVARHARAEQQRPLALEQQHEARKIARVLVKQPFGRRARGLRVAEHVEHHERVAALQRAQALAARRCGRMDVERADLVVGNGRVPSSRARAGHGSACAAGEKRHPRAAGRARHRRVTHHTVSRLAAGTAASAR